jgi:hypothetical protein
LLLLLELLPQEQLVVLRARQFLAWARELLLLLLMLLGLQGVDWLC